MQLRASPRSFRGWRRPELSIICCLIIAAQQAVFLPDLYGQSRPFTNGFRLPLSAGSTLHVDNLSGNIQIVLSRRSDLEVSARRHSAALTNIRPEEVLVEQGQEQVTIITRPVKNTGGIDLKLSLPEGTSLMLTSETGNIEISGAAGNVIAKTQNGNIQMSLPENMNADVALTSVNGTVRTTRAIKPVGDLDSHSLHGQIGDGGNVLVAHSKNGQVTLTTNKGDLFARLSERAPVRNRLSPLRPPSLSPQPLQPLLPSQPDDDPSDQQSMVPPPKSLAPVPQLQPQLQPQPQPQPLGPSSKQPATASKPQLRKPDQARNTSPTNPPTIAKNEKKEKKEKEEKDENVLKIESQLVLLNAIVSNSSGQPVLDLQKEDFQVYEDKIQQEVSHFQTVKSPFNLVLLIDLSGSIRDKIRLVQRAALHFVQSIRPEDRVGIVTFTGITRVVSPLTNDREELRRRIESIDRPEGGTNFYDALKETLDLIESSVNGERNAVVIMSDGVDNSLPNVPGTGSLITFDELNERVQESETVIFPIYLDTEQEASEQYGGMMSMAYSIARKQLQELADATGGTMYYAKRVEDLEGHYDEVAAALRTIYSLGYYPNNSANDGTYRRIHVEVKRDGAKVKSRRGYYAKKD